MGRGMRGRRGAAVLVAVLLALAAVPAASAAVRPPQARPDLVDLLGRLRHQYSAPGGALTFGDGVHDTTLSSGTGELLLNRPIRSTDLVRVGSDTKMFTAVVALQLVGAGRLELDVPIERYLPGVLRYPADKVPGEPQAYDGRAVTLRQLLQHTAGVPEYADYPYLLSPVHQVRPPTARELVDHALPNGPGFRPGHGWRYSNTDYALVGMVVEARSGRPLGTEIRERIVEPLGLTRTFFAERGQKALPGPHVHGYLTELVPADVTQFEPGVWGAAGALVSTADDMNAFTDALLAGRVLAPAQLAEMQRTVPYGTGGYGLGIVSLPLSCGVAWGHGGFVAGYQTLGLALPNGRHAFMTMNSTVALNLLPAPSPASAFDLFERALC